MSLTEQFNQIERVKFALGKNTKFAENFAKDCGANSMYDPGFGLGVPNHISPEGQLRSVFSLVSRDDGVFLFNISGVDLTKAEESFHDYDEADGNNQIAEWELSIILNDEDYLSRCLFHNGKVRFNKESLWHSIVK